MAVYLEIDGRSVELAIKNTQEFLAAKNVLYRLIGRTLRDYVRTAITVQGRPIPWAPIAKSTRDKTGRRKVFISLREDIKYVSGPDEVVIELMRATRGWNLKMHARGYTIPARKPVMGKAMKWQSRGTNVFARSARQAIVPARSVYPSAPEGARVIEPVINDWINRHMAKTWR